MEVKQILALDVGQNRTGIARASAVARLAEPLMTVETARVSAVLRRLSRAQDIEAIVVGLPRNMQGQDTAQTDWVRQWVTDIKQEIDLPFYWQDEALTSKLAENLSPAHKKDHSVDALAAGIILQDFLDTAQAERVVC